jgi:serine/threonine protein kinase
MLRCSACSTEIPESSRFCLSCGSGLPSDPTSVPTVAMPSEPSSHPDLDERFLPGTLLMDRYRILGRLGKGGMGEVYRAVDVRLGQTVALKFLPATAAQSPAILARFYNEVRIARQVTHPNVCRVFDIGEVDGQPFIQCSTSTAKTRHRCCGESAVSQKTKPSRSRADYAPVLRPPTRKVCCTHGDAAHRGVGLGCVSKRARWAENSGQASG